MSTRRAHLAAIGLTAAAPLVALSPASARAATPLEFTARRTEITIPDVPSLGLSYICLLDLFDPSGTKVGQASSSSFIVTMTLEGPVVLGSIVLHLADGDIHYQRLIDRYGGYPRTATGAILGGTGEYAGVGGEVEVVWPDAHTVNLTVHIS